MQYNDSYNEFIMSFANNVHTPDGGTHETGFKNALTKVINEYGKKFGLLKDGERLTGDDVREGLTAIISVKMTNCEFEGQTKGRLGNPEIKPLVESVVQEKLSDYLEENRKRQKLSLKNPLRLSVQEKPQKKQEIMKEKERTHWIQLHFPESLRIVLKKMPSLQKFISSREIRRAVQPRTEETDIIRLYFLSGEKCLTLKKQG